MNFTIEYDKQPQKFLKKLNNESANRIISKIDELLTETPVPHNAKSILGEHGVFRIRIGDFRALYRINYNENKIIIFKVDKRSRVYEKIIRED